MLRRCGLPEFQDAGAKRMCGSMSLDDVQFAWFEEKLRGRSGTIDAALASGEDFCLSLAPGDAIAVESTRRGGDEFTIDASTPQRNGALGVLGALLGNAAREALLATQSLATVPAGGAVLAGLPLLDATIDGLSGIESILPAASLRGTGALPFLDPGEIVRERL